MSETAMFAPPPGKDSAVGGDGDAVDVGRRNSDDPLTNDVDLLGKQLDRQVSVA
eukprot:CAMPEP_0196691364 /NCGR_PEP_ID=MMETSP1090-20130531/23679_1 /TAXON_ID=37098 /ORGANISM="Isochrysis sp, Strain CCMP1244" /LENGTH=53 /DNA_ID=CAMNT_0042030605 /DNA_START=112 /DNA_END=273 /DNA_ORIENTATION=-